MTMRFEVLETAFKNRVTELENRLKKWEEYKEKIDELWKYHIDWDADDD